MKTFAKSDNFGQFSSITLTAKWQKLALAYSLRIKVEPNSDDKKQIDQLDVLN